MCSTPSSRYEIYLVDHLFPTRAHNFTNGIPENSSTSPKSINAHNDITITSIAAFPNGERFATGAGEEVKIWNARSLAPEGTWECPGTVCAVAVTPDGLHIIAACWIHICVWESCDPLRSPVHTFRRAHGGSSVFALALTPRGDSLLSGCNDGHVIVWNIDERRKIAKMSLSGEHQGHRVNSLCVTTDGTRVVMGTEVGLMHVWCLQSHTPIGVLAGHASVVWSLGAFPSDASLVASGSDDRSLRVWDVGAMQQLHAMEGISVYAVCVSPDGGHVLSGGMLPKGRVGPFDPPEVRISRGRVHMWDTSSFEAVHSMECDVSVTALAVSPGYDMIIAGTAKGQVYVWEGPGMVEPK